MSTLDQYIGTLVGCAVGDVLGMPVENWKREHIKKYVGGITGIMDVPIPRDANGNKLKSDEFGKIGYGITRKMNRGDYTDDTILTLAIAESIAAKKGLDLGDIAKRQFLEYDKRIMPNGYVMGGFGSTTKKAFENLKKGVSPEESGLPGPGTGPAMKMAPVGIYMDATERYSRGLYFADKIGRITHTDPRSIAGGLVQAYSVYRLLQGIEREDFVNEASSLCAGFEDFKTKYPGMVKPDYALFGGFRWILENRDADSEEAFKALGNSGLAFEAHPFAFFMFQKYWNQPLEGLIETINFGGDCDTTGAIYGALCGAKYGMIFPDEWVNEIKGVDKLVSAAKGIYDLKQRG